MKIKITETEEIKDLKLMQNGIDNASEYIGVWECHSRDADNNIIMSQEECDHWTEAINRQSAIDDRISELSRDQKEEYEILVDAEIRYMTDLDGLLALFERILDDITKPDIGGNIRKAREAASMSQTQLAKAVNMTQAMISRYEQGERTPDGYQLIAIAKALGIEPGELLK